LIFVEMAASIDGDGIQIVDGVEVGVRK